MSNQPTITMYTTSTCGFCHKAKRFMETHQIEFTEINANTPEGRNGLERSNSNSVPTIIIGDQVVIGFQEQKLMDLLGLKIVIPLN